MLAHFWRNHFHAINKGTNIYYESWEDMQFFRANAFGSFEDLLMHSAKSPLMSQYLDNDESRAGSINENYAREVLELHTVGVNTNYGDQDIIEVARVFTGWRYRQTNSGNGSQSPRYDFEFQADRHDAGDKTIPFLGRTISGRSGAAGVEEGEELLRILASHDNTKAHICSKLVQLLVADQPPQNFVDACVNAWNASNGNMGAVVRAIVTDPAYIGTVQYQRNKAKTPFEYAMSAMRFTGATPSSGQQNNYYSLIRRSVRESGYVMFDFPAPTGLPEVGAAWQGAGSLLLRSQHLQNLVRNGEQAYGIDTQNFIQQENLETAEAVAAYLMTVAMADRFQSDEFEQIVDVLKGSDGIFEPRNTNERVAVRRALAAILVLPSFQLQ